MGVLSSPAAIGAIADLAKALFAPKNKTIVIKPGPSDDFQAVLRQLLPPELGPERAVEHLLAVKDANADGLLGREELNLRPEHFARLDIDGNGSVGREELLRAYSEHIARG